MSKVRNCCGCGKPTIGVCWTDCGMSLCGSPLCGDCIHVDKPYGWRHERAIASVKDYLTDQSMPLPGQPKEGA